MGKSGYRNILVITVFTFLVSNQSYNVLWLFKLRKISGIGEIVDGNARIVFLIFFDIFCYGIRDDEVNGSVNQLQCMDNIDVRIFPDYAGIEILTLTFVKMCCFVIHV